MMGSEYTYDKEKVGFRKVRFSVWKWCRRGFAFLLASMSMAVLYYVIFALVFSTDTERRLKLANDMYAQEMPELERKERMVSDVVEGLRARDNRIYEEIFHIAHGGNGRKFIFQTLFPLRFCFRIF